MNKFDEIITEIKADMDNMTFGDVIREARERMGIRQYKAAEFMNLTMGRLKRLETNFFRSMPQADELRNVCEFYELPLQEMIKKAEEHVASVQVKEVKADRYFNG